MAVRAAHVRSSRSPSRGVRSALFAVLVAVSALGCGGLPGVIRDDMAKTAQVKPRAATVVFFTDFQCPYCRKTHAALAPLVDARHDRVRVVLRHVPLARHPDARTAARASICVERIASALSEDYTRALFASPSLSEAACEALAVERGIDRDRYRECLADAATDARIEQDVARFEAVDGDGVPLVYVGRRRLDGAQPRAILEAALDEAISAE